MAGLQIALVSRPVSLSILGARGMQGVQGPVGPDGNGFYTPEAYMMAADNGDHALAWARMIAATADGAAYLALGQYVFKSSLVVAANDRSIQFGAAGKITRGAAGGDLIELWGSDWKIRYGEMDGQRANFASGNSNLFITGARNEVYGLDSHDAFDHALAIDGVNGAALGDHNRVLFCKLHDCNKIGLSQYKAKGTTILAPEIFNTGAEGATFDFGTTQAKMFGGSIDMAGLIGAVGGIGMDASQDNTISRTTITRTQNRLPGVCCQCETGDTSYNDIDVDCFDNTGNGVLLRYNTQSYPTVDATKHYQSNYNKIRGSFRGNTLAPIRIDAHCDSNVIGASNYSGGMLPDIDPLAINTRIEGGAGLCSFRAAGNGTSGQTNITGDGTYAQVIVPFEEASEPTPPDGASPYNPVTGVFTASVSGPYTVNCSVELASTSTITTATLEIRQAGSDNKIGHNDTYSAAGSAFLTVNVSRTFRLAAGDTLTVWALAKTAGNAKNTSITSNGATVRFEAYLIG